MMTQRGEFRKLAAGRNAMALCVAALLLFLGGSPAAAGPNVPCVDEDEPVDLHWLHELQPPPVPTPDIGPRSALVDPRCLPDGLPDADVDTVRAGLTYACSGDADFRRYQFDTWYVLYATPRAQCAPWVASAVVRAALYADGTLIDGPYQATCREGDWTLDCDGWSLSHQRDETDLPEVYCMDLAWTGYTSEAPDPSYIINTGAATVCHAFRERYPPGILPTMGNEPGFDDWYAYNHIWNGKCRPLSVGYLSGFHLEEHLEPLPSAETVHIGYCGKHVARADLFAYTWHSVATDDGRVFWESPYNVPFDGPGSPRVVSCLRGIEVPVQGYDKFTCETSSSVFARPVDDVGGGLNDVYCSLTRSGWSREADSLKAHGVEVQMCAATIWR
jgi:hypothetical protein